jgi:hypothetical protein
MFNVAVPKLILKIRHNICIASNDLMREGVNEIFLPTSISTCECVRVDGMSPLSFHPNQGSEFGVCGPHDWLPRQACPLRLMGSAVCRLVHKPRTHNTNIFIRVKVQYYVICFINEL